MTQPTLDEAADELSSSWFKGINISDMAKSVLRKRIKPSLAIRKVKPNDSIPIGRSKVGGRPDLPKGTAWPESQIDGHVMTFLCQINLSELPVATELPNIGILSIFLDLDEPAYNIGNHWIYIPETSDISPRDFPTGKSSAVDTDNSGNLFKQCELSFEPSFTVSTDSEDFDHLSDEDKDLVYDNSPNDHTRLFGWHQEWNGDARRDAYLYANGLEQFQYTHWQDPAWLKDEDDHLNEIENWKILFSLGSLFEAGMCWWDAGILEFVIHKDALKKNDFSKIYCNLATS